MKRATVEQLAVFTGLVAVSVALRMYFREIPNFAPVAAVALFAGYLFPSRGLAILAPITVMLITDHFLGGYQPLLMLTVYGLLALPVLMRDWLRRSFQATGSAASAARAVVGLLGCTFTASLLFFVATNFATWLVTPWYPRTAAGLWHCYANAIPFFRYTLAGDCGFAFLLFGGYALAQRLAGQPLANRAAVTPANNV